MSSELLAKHFALLSITYCSYNIKSPRQLFNIDESGLSTRTESRTWAKALTRTDSRCDSVELKWRSNCEHYTVIPDVSVGGKLWNPVVILQGCKPRFRKNATVNAPEVVYTETAADFLPNGAFISMH